ncbi:MAG: hypothetical protein JKY65_14475 [Planctomycetes bacterium]|nr:hypothetical protein [Planctomycetota bacterium]
MSAEPFDGLAAHRALRFPWAAPPGELVPWLEALAGVGFSETGAQETYLVEIDLPAHEGDAGREARFRSALGEVRRFRRELRALRRLRHDNVLSVLDAGDPP